RMAGDAALAEELAQDVFVRAWEKLASFRGESAFSSWLHPLTVNVALTERRSRRRRTARVTTTDDLTAFEKPTRRPGPEAGMDLERALATLPPGARSVFVLHDVEGYQHNEISALIGVAEGTSKAQLHRARRMLREALESGPARRPGTGWTTTSTARWAGPSSTRWSCTSRAARSVPARSESCARSWPRP